jgi:nucleoside-triphosphatase
VPMRHAPKLLLEGRPGIGKTTAAERIVARLRDAGLPVSGFVTREMREGRQRVGFTLVTLDGDHGTLAHVDFPGPPRVGKYGVDLAVLEEIGIPAVSLAPSGEVVVVDELGKMELASSSFREAVSAVTTGSAAFVATVHVARHPFTDALKRADNVETLRVTHQNRDRLPEEVTERLLASEALS